MARRLELNARVLAALEDLGISDAGRLVHHASEAGDVDALVRYAPLAARDAATSGAHREAAAHYALALAHEDRFTPAELADLFEECAVERYTIGAAADAVTAQRRAVALRRQLEDRRALGLSLRWLSRIMWFDGQRASADEAAEEATAHAMSQAMAQGVALALEDVLVQTETLSSLPVREALPAYEQRRTPRIGWVRAQTIAATTPEA